MKALTVMKSSMLVFAVFSSFALAQEPKPEVKTVTFGNVVPVKGSYFVRKTQIESTSILSLQGETTITKTIENKRWNVVILDSTPGKVIAAKFTLARYKNQTNASKPTTVDSRIGKTFQVSWSEEQLKIQEVNPEKGKEASLLPKAHLKFAKDLKNLLPRGIVFDAGHGRSLLLKDKTFEIGKTYLNVLSQSPEMEVYRKASKDNGKEVKISDWMTFLSLTKVDGFECVAVSMKTMVETTFEKDKILMYSKTFSDEKVTIAIKNCWHVKSMTEYASTVIRKQTTGEKEIIDRVDTKSLTHETTKLKRKKKANTQEK